MAKQNTLQDEDYFSEENQERLVRDFAVAYLTPNTLEVDFTRYATLKDYNRFGYICYWDWVPGKHEIALINYLSRYFGSPSRFTPIIDRVGRGFLDKAKVRKIDGNRSISVEDGQHQLLITIFPEERKRILALFDGEDVTEILDLHLSKEKGKYVLSHSINIGDPTKPMKILDERFKEFPALLDRYTGRIKTSNVVRRNATSKLYSLIILLLEEKRVKGNFKLMPVTDWQIEKMNKKIANMQRQVDNFSKYVKSVHKKYGGKLSP